METGQNWMVYGTVLLYADVDGDFKIHGMWGIKLNAMHYFKF